MADFRATFARQKSLHPELWVATHASQSGLAEKYKRGSDHDPAGYRDAVLCHERLFEDAVRKQGVGR